MNEAAIRNREYTLTVGGIFGTVPVQVIGVLEMPSGDKHVKFREVGERTTYEWKISDFASRAVESTEA